jgi:ribosomal protein S21
MVVITKRKGETKDSMFRKFTKTFIDENIVDDVRKKQFYKKPSLVRQEKLKIRMRGGIGQIRKKIRKVGFTRKHG